MTIPPYSSGTPNATFTNSGKIKQLVYNVRDYGATGNGTTDDTTAIQNTINTANTAGGGIVELSQGTFLVSSTLTIPVSDVIIRGTGASALFTVPNSFNSTLFSVGTTSSYTQNVRFEDFAVNLNSSNCTSGTVFSFMNTIQTFVTKVICNNVFNYVVQYNKSGSYDCYNNWVEGCDFGTCGGFVNEISCETNIYMNNYMSNAVGVSGGTYPLYVNGGGSNYY